MQDDVTEMLARDLKEAECSKQSETVAAFPGSQCAGIFIAVSHLYDHSFPVILVLFGIMG